MPKMTKPECKRVLESLFPEWKHGRAASELEHPSFTQFKAWAVENGYGDCFRFRSVAGADFDVEIWFDRYFKQTWRN